MTYIFKVKLCARLPVPAEIEANIPKILCIQDIVTTGIICRSLWGNNMAIMNLVARIHGMYRSLGNRVILFPSTLFFILSFFPGLLLNIMLLLNKTKETVVAQSLFVAAQASLQHTPKQCGCGNASLCLCIEKVHVCHTLPCHIWA